MKDLHANEEFIIDGITCSKENPRYQVIDNVLYSRDLKTLIRYIPGKPERYFSVPDHVEHLASNAFMYASHLQCVKVGKNVKTVGSRCFYDCHDLRHVYIGEGVGVLEGEEIFALPHCHIARNILVIGGKASSAAARWCAEINEHHGEYCGANAEYFLDAIPFAAVEGDEIDEFLALPLPDLREDKYLAKFWKTMDEIKRNKPSLPENDLPF